MAARRRPAIETFATGTHLKWDVRWVVKKKGKWYIIVHEFGSDLNAAMTLYLKVKQTDRHYVTLRCRNSGFPPPQELQAYWHHKKIKTQVKVRGKTKTSTTYKDVYRSPMKRRNREGKWWCPYCRELREFVLGYELPFIHPPIVALKGFGDGRPDVNDAQLYCPLCLANTSDHNVRKWNPLAERFS